MLKQFYYLLVFLFGAYFPVLAQENPIKHALIIAIGKYPRPNENLWTVINSHRDTFLVKNVLMDQDFDPKNITILSDANATRQGIERSLDKLIANVKKNDIVVLHVSAHGAQIEDDDQNEEPDFLDECIVPYGAIYSFDANKYSEIEKGYYRDDELGEKIVQLRNKLGAKGNVLVVLDACHSGSGIRDKGEIIRGPNFAIVSPGFEKRKLTNKPDPGVIHEPLSSTKLNADAATYVSISGAQSDQPNSECRDDHGNSVGSLSFAFSKAMNQLPKGATYKTLFSRIEKIMAMKVPSQRPVLEGDGVDKELFGSNYFEQKRFLNIVSNQTTPGSIVLDGGSIWGITKGSKIGFYPESTLNPAGKTPLATGIVSSVSLFSSTVVVDNKSTPIDKDARAFVTELAWGDRKLRLNVLDKDGVGTLVNDRDNFQKALAGFELAQFSGDYDAYFQLNPENQTWSLFQKNSNDPFATRITIADSNGVNNLKEALRRFDRMNYLKELEISEMGISARVEIVFLKDNDYKKEIDTVMIRKRTVNGRLQLIPGDIVFLKIVNTGDRMFWYNVVDIQPDGFINPILPNQRLKNAQGANDPFLVQDCKLEIYDSTIIRRMRIKISPPFGHETFKVFLSTKQFNFEEILATDNQNTTRNIKGTWGSLEKLFVKSKVNKIGKRVGTEAIDPDQTGTMFNVGFTIVKD